MPMTTSSSTSVKAEGRRDRDLDRIANSPMIATKVDHTAFVPVVQPSLLWLSRANRNVRMSAQIEMSGWRRLTSGSMDGLGLESRCV